MTSSLRSAAAALGAGAILGLCGAGLGAAPAIAVAGLLVVAALRTRPRAAWTAAACVAAALVGLVRGDAAAHGPASVVPQELAAVVGTVTRAADFDEAPLAAMDESEREAVFQVAPDGRDDRLDVRVTYREGDAMPALLPGDRVRLVGTVAPLRRPTNPGEPDRRDELRRQGVCGSLHVPSAGAVTDAGVAPMSVATRICRVGEIVRRKLLTRLREACGGPGPTPALLGCLLLGDRSGLAETTADAFRDSGTAHLLSVSGLHVVLLAHAARLLARRTVPRRARRRLALPSLVTLLLVYCALCRFATPVVRAAVFLAVAETARTFGRRPSPLDTLAVAAALVLAADAAQALDPSFQLSFAAVAGLALFTRGFREALFPTLALYRKFPGAISKRRMWIFERFAAAWSTSLAASAATAPVVAQVFGRLQPSAPVSNLVAVPLAAVLVPLAAVLSLTGGCAAWLTAPLAHAAVAPLAASVSLAARLPGATWEIGVPPAPLVALSGCFLVAAAWVVGRRPRWALRLAWVSWLTLAATPFVRPSADVPEIVALDVGHGLCLLARPAEGGDVLFDAGGHAPRIGRRIVLPALRALGVRRLAAVFVSHHRSSRKAADAGPQDVGYRHVRLESSRWIPSRSGRPTGRRKSMDKNELVAAHEGAHSVIAVLIDVELGYVMMSLDQDHGLTYWPAQAAKPGRPDIRDVALAVAGSCSDGIRKKLTDGAGRVVADRLDDADVNMAWRFAYCAWGDGDALNDKRVQAVQGALVPLLASDDFAKAIDVIAVPLLAEARRKGSRVDAFIVGKQVPELLRSCPLAAMRKDLAASLRTAEATFPA